MGLIRLCFVLAGYLACGVLAPGLGQAKGTQDRPDTKLIMAEPQDVEDVALLDREFGAWKFGSGILLEAGYMPGIYELHHGVTLIRFNCSGLTCDTVQHAALRVYKPNCT